MLLVAGEGKEARRFLNDARIHERSPYLRVVTSPHHMRGYRACVVVCVGSYEKRKDWDEIRNELVYKAQATEPRIKATLWNCLKLWWRNKGQLV